MLLKDKVALVTGASRGIGRAVAITLARGGAKVALNYAGNEAAAAEALRLVEEAGAPQARLYRFDVADPGACAAAVERWWLSASRKSRTSRSSRVIIDGGAP